MRTSARLSVRCGSAQSVRTLRSVLKPDNEGVPRGLKFSMEGVGEVLEFNVQADSAPTVISTCLALLGDITLFEQVWLLSRPRHAGAREGP